MSLSRVLQAELTSEAAIAVVVELSHLEPGEKTLVQATVTQEGAVADATALVTGAAPAGPQRAHLVAVPRSGTFVPDAPLMAFAQTTTVWTTQLTPASGPSAEPRWTAAAHQDGGGPSGSP